MSIAEVLPGPGMEFERTPPQDIAAEQGVLGGMLLSKDAIADVIEVIRGGDFYRPAHEMIYDVALDLYSRGEPADAVTVSAELTKRGEIGRVGGAPYLHTLISSVPTAANAGYYARIVRERAILRRLVEAGTRITQLGYSADGDVDEVVDRAQAEVYSVTERRVSEDYLPLSSIMQGTLDEIEAIDAHDGSLIGVPTGFADLDSLTNGLHPGQMVIVAARPAVGKALALDTPLPTPTGWTTMGEVRVGDQLLAADGTPTVVLATTEVMSDRPCFEIIFDDGTVVTADAEHQWLTETRASRKSRQAAEAQYNRYRSQRTFASVKTSAEIAATLRCKTSDNRLNHCVANAHALVLDPVDLPVHPYVLGAWLGDGHSASARLTSGDPEIPMFFEGLGLRVTKHASMSYTFRLPETPPLDTRECVMCGKAFEPRTAQVRTCGQSCGGRAKYVTSPVAAPSCPRCGGPSVKGGLCLTCYRSSGSVQALLRGLGVLGNKHIPVEYLRAGTDQRRELLAGLLDTDGTVNANGSVQFCVTNRQLAYDTRELIMTLGYRCGMSTRQVRGRSVDSSTAYTITFTTDDVVFKLERKRLLHKERGQRRHQRTFTRFIAYARPVPSVPVRCVQIAHPSHLYLATRSMIPTHNSTLALDIARSATIAHNLPTVFFSLEMGRNEITMRLLAAEAKVHLQHMRSGTMREEDWDKLARRMNDINAAPLFIDDSPNMSMMEIRAKCRRLKQRHGLRLVIVDYLQLMTSGKRVESRQVEVSEFSRSMKLLAKELDVPVIAICQLNRGPEQRTDKKPMLSDLRESGSLEQDADVVMLLHREDLYERESPRAGEADIIVAKHRNGPTGSITVAFQGHYSRFVDMARG